MNTDSLELDEHSIQQLNSDPLLARLLAVRGIKDSQEAERFLSGGHEHVHDPFLLDGMQTAVDRIRLAVERDERIRIYGDYDADGVTSTALMCRLLERLGARFDYYIPHRHREGYGLNKGAMDHAHKHGVSLVITVDTGISAVEEVAYAAGLGMDVIVTDHHEPPEVLPQAHCVVNPKKPGCPYPYKGLAGVGVAFKLAHALLGELPEELFELAAIGTVADLMPLTGENRILVRTGVQRLRTTSHPGILALLDVAGIEAGDVSASHIAFSLTPRINAGGRLEHADDAVRLLLARDRQEAEHLAHDLDRLNRERQRIVDELAKEAAAIVEAAPRMPEFIVVAGVDWNAGVLGIVASKLVERYYRPTIVLSIDGETGMCKGSARSISGFDMYQALARNSELLPHYGGHQAAAGLSIHRDDLPLLEQRLNELAGLWLTEEDYTPMIAADIECPLPDVGIELIDRINALAPFGMGNPSPRFVFTGIPMKELKLMGRDRQHLKLVLPHEGQKPSASIEAVGFGKGALADKISSTARFDLLCELSINEWNGTRKPQLIIQDLRIPHVQVFDWRGTREPAVQIGHLLERLKRDVGPDAAPAVIVFAEEELAELMRSELSGSCPLWLIDGDGRELAANELAQARPLRAARDIVVYSMPLRLASVQAALSVLAAAERIYALFAPMRPLPVDVSRNAFKQVYSLILQAKQWRINDEARYQHWGRAAGLKAETVRFAVEVFEELEFIRLENGQFTAVEAPAKKPLGQSQRVQALEAAKEAEELLVFSTADQLTSWMLDQLNVSTSNKLMEELV